ncbi:MAG: DUF4920 domain-containing protein [Gemmatimonadota bacterium]
MMGRTAAAFALLLPLVMVNACATPQDTFTEYGEELTLSETTSISAILADPAAYVGLRVLVEGTVVDVCEMKGCWLGLAGEQDFEQLRVKVDDGVIVFPMTAKGLQARVEGVVEKLEYTLEEAIEQARHEAEEYGTEFDPSSVTGPKVVYQIRGIGAQVGDFQ